VFEEVFLLPFKIKSPDATGSGPDEVRLEAGRQNPPNDRLDIIGRAGRPERDIEPFAAAEKEVVEARTAIDVVGTDGKGMRDSEVLLTRVDERFVNVENEQDPFAGHAVPKSSWHAKKIAVTRAHLLQDSDDAGMVRENRWNVLRKEG